MHAALMLLAFLVQDDVARARALLDQAAAKLKDAPAITFERETLQSQSGSTTVPEPMLAKISTRRPNHLRLDTTGKDWDSLYLMDGATFWYFDRRKNEYIKTRQMPGTAGSSWDDPFLHLFSGRGVERILDGAKEIRVTESKEKGEVLDVIVWKDRGRWERADSVECTLWLGRDRVLRGYSRQHEDVKSGQTITKTMSYAKVDLAPKLGDDSFAFTPPAGAKLQKPYRSPGDEIPDSEEARKAHALLKEVHKAFSKADSLSYEYEWVSRGPDGAETVRYTTATSLKRPGLIREDRGMAGSALMICDGQVLWNITPRMRTYTKSELLFPAHRLLTQVDPLIQLFFEGEDIEILAGASDIKLDRELVGELECDVLSWTRSQGETTVKNKVFIDPERRLIRRETAQTYQEKTYTSTISYRKFDAAAALSEGSFTFKPVEGWIDRTGQRYGQTYLKAGTAAPDFEMVDRAGDPIKLSEFKGRIVVLYFSFFSHKPGLDQAQALHDAVAARGVVVLAVDLSEAKSAYDPKKHTFRLVRPKDVLIAREYGAESFSATYVLDAEGKVSATVGQPEEAKPAVDKLVPQDKKDGSGPKKILEEAVAALKDRRAVAYALTWRIPESADNVCRVITQNVLRRPDQLRVEMAFKDNRGRNDPFVYVLDGKKRLGYDANDRLFREDPQKASDLVDMYEDPIRLMFFAGASEKWMDFKTDLSESQEKLNGRTCSVIEWRVRYTSDVRYRLWIDESRMVRRLEKRVGTGLHFSLEYGDIDLDPKIPENAFTVTPAGDVKSRSWYGEFEKVLIAVGSEAPAFAAKDLEGRKVELTDYKGKPILLLKWTFP